MTRNPFLSPIAGGGGGGGGGASDISDLDGITVADTAPASPTEGDLWVDTATNAGFSGASVYRTATAGSQALATNTFVLAQHDAEVFDTDGYHDTSTNTDRLTIPAGMSGKYRIVGQVELQYNSGARSRACVIWKNGTSGVRLAQTIVSVSTDSESTPARVQAHTGVVDLVAGDYVGVAGWQNSGNSLNMQGSDTGIATWLRLEKAPE